MSNSVDTIVAIATPPGKGGVGIIRISGPKVSEIAKKVIKQLPMPRSAEFCDFLDDKGEVLDQGVALYFKAPHSFTGEDVLELQGHGGPVILDLILKNVLNAGARLARPGEFSERAFLNNKIDLVQAESIADLINAQSEQAAKSALHSLQGEFSKCITELVDALIQLRMYVEASLDFPEEEIDFLADKKVLDSLEKIIKKLEEVLISAKQGRLLQEGMTIAIVGKPNVGKSSLLNQLSGQESAIVTDIPGTTRDILREMIQVDGLPLHILDTAGLRDSENIVEQEGIKRAKQAMEKADKILLMIDSWEDKDVSLIDFIALEQQIVVHNKIDLTREKPKIVDIENIKHIYLSAKTGEGLELLKQYLKQCMGFDSTVEGNFIARRRHLNALNCAREHLAAAKEQLTANQAGELLAEELLQAQNALSEITGEFRSDDLLGKIFSEFCIGK